MIRLKQQLHPMHLRCNIKHLLLVFSIAISFLFIGCNKTPDNAITQSEWIKALSENAGITQYVEKEPYYINIQRENNIYDETQALVEWGVLETIYPINPDDFLTKEWCAYTLVNLMGNENVANNIQLANDIQSSKFNKYINTAISSGLMNVDKRNLFHPQDILDKEEALNYLKLVVDIINDRQIDENHINEIKFINEGKVHQLDNLKSDNQKMVEDISQYKEGDYLKESNDQNEIVYRITKIEDDVIYYEECDPLEIIEKIDVEGIQTIDFDDATIIDANGEVIQDGKSSFSDSNIQLMAFHPYIKKMEYKGFEIEIRTSKSQISLDVKKEISDSQRFYGNIKLSGIQAKYQWKSKKKDVDSAYLKFDYNLEEKIGYSTFYNKKSFADLSELKSDDFLNSLTSIFESKNSEVNDTFTLCTIQMPIANVPTMNLTIELNLQVSANGKAEIVLTQENTSGFEIKNGRIRIIKEQHGDGNANINASLEGIIKSRLALCAIEKALMDMELELGASISAKGKIHLYDDEGKKTSKDTDISTDLLTSAALANQNVLSCVDVSGKWIANLIINTNQSSLGKYGFQIKANLLENKNADIFSKGSHLENWIAVKACSRKDKILLEYDESLDVKEEIDIDKYSIRLKVNENKKFTIDNLPNGYDFKDLIFDIEDSNIAKIDSNYNVLGISKGNTIMHIHSKDNKYNIYCHINVLD